MNSYVRAFLSPPSRTSNASNGHALDAVAEAA
jgi:hypothetical protein